MNGWVCPKCGASLSPMVGECPHCAPMVAKPIQVQPWPGYPAPYVGDPPWGWPPTVTYQARI